MGKVWRRASGLMASLAVCQAVIAFVPPQQQVSQRRHDPSLFKQRREQERHPTSPQNKCTTTSRISRLFMANYNSFDISRPVFDFLSLRNVRGDALVRYNALNQSEPLRISLYFILVFSCGVAPSLSESVGYDDLSLPATLGWYAASLSSLALLLRECSRRSRQLQRIEKELNTESLPIKLPMSLFSDTPYTQATTLQELRRLSNPPRILALAGSRDKLNEALQGLAVVGRRLQQSTTFVVPIPTDCQVSDLQLFSSSTSSSTSTSTRYPWIANADNLEIWKAYFDSLTEDDDRDDTSPTANSSHNKASSFQWFGLNSNGRSFGSGKDEIPLWLEILGQHLRPTTILEDSSSTDASKTADIDLVQSLETFYRALTTGDEAGMRAIFSSEPSSQVSQVVQEGGRLDQWKDCLVEGARPQNMKVSGIDTFLVSELEAYTTAVEFPANNNNIIIMDEDATLLAVQHWKREFPSSAWQLQLHQTIPWTPATKAQGTLRCDCQGCVALTRGPERRTFGGLMG